MSQTAKIERVARGMFRVILPTNKEVTPFKAQRESGRRLRDLWIVGEKELSQAKADQVLSSIDAQVHSAVAG